MLRVRNIAQSSSAMVIVLILSCASVPLTTSCISLMADHLRSPRIGQGSAPYSLGQLCTTCTIDKSGNHIGLNIDNMSCCNRVHSIISMYPCFKKTIHRFTSSVNIAQL